VRSPDEFAGRFMAPAHLPQEQEQRAGHIPTGEERPLVECGAGGQNLHERRGAPGDAGVDPGTDTIAYCRIGERSAHTWFVLHELFDGPNVRNYDGSWTEYGSLVGVPIETEG
jgi:thiosulfate/3-mercaptopyruvate sulfurtransferase